MSEPLSLPKSPTKGDVFKIAWPLMLKAMMLNGIVVIDAYLVSSLGESAVAALGLAAAFGNLLLGIILAFSTATQIRIAQAFGSRRPAAIKTGVYAGMVINLAVAAIGVIVVLAISGPLIDQFAHTPNIAEQARAYLNVFLFLILIEAVSQCLGSYFNGCGKTVIPFRSYLIGLPINVFVSYCFIHGNFGFPALGVMGAALGSAVASVVQFIFMALVFFRQNGGLLGDKGWLNGTFGSSVKRHLMFALPIAGTFASNAFAVYVLALLFAKMSVIDFAALTLITPWINLTGFIGTSVATATGIIVAQMLGSGQRGPQMDVFLKMAWRMAFVAAGIVSLTYLVVCLGSSVIYGALEKQTQAAIFSFLPFLLLLPFPKGSNAMCGHTLRASGDTVYVMNIFVAAQWLFRVPLTALFILYFDLSVMWVFSLFVVEELVRFPVFHRRLLKGDWKYRPQDA
jgi:putative MATE family efflux protein